MRFGPLVLLVLFLTAGTAAAQAPPPAQDADAKPWPRSFTQDGTQVTLHHPQIDSWEGNVLKARIAVAVKTGEAKDAEGKMRDALTYGVMWLQARTDTDKAAHTVTLRDVAIEKVSFPTAADKQDQYLALLRKIMPEKPITASLDTIESDLAIGKADEGAQSVAVKNDPPVIHFSFKPALLVLIDGNPVLKDTGVAGIERVINTHALVLKADNEFYLRFAGQWAKAPKVEGPWTKAKAALPAKLEQATQKIVAAKLADPLDKPAEMLKDALKKGSYPEIVVATEPTELILIDGEPQFADVKDTQLSYVVNTGSDVFVDRAHENMWYVLISGRWFNAPSTQGLWKYVAGNELPADFARIPSDSPKSAVLASIPGTPEARVSLIANSIPQTATVDRSKANLKLSYDGEPQFKSIEGTTLTYAVNASSPVIRTAQTDYYSLHNGVWFVAHAPQGPWTVTTNVPAAIYGIPASSPLHYVTYVQVYGSNGDQVYVGYTPGYYGTVASSGTVVYGTGYPCNSWVGDSWYPCPSTYGYSASFGWDALVGWSLGFAWGWAMSSSWYGPGWGPWYGGWGYWGGGVAATNVYGRWGNRAIAGTGAAWADPWTGNYGRGGAGGFYNPVTGGRGRGYAGWNTNAYTGVTTGQAGSVRYNPQTGRAVAHQGGAVVNPNTGREAAGGTRTSVNTRTGRATTTTGVAGRGPEGAGAAGTFSTKGPRGGDGKGAGYVHYDRASGQVTHGGVVDFNDHVYAGKDGNVYRYDKGEGWQKAGPNGAFNKAQPPSETNLEQARAARDRGNQRSFDRTGGRLAGGNVGQGLSGASRPGFDRGQLAHGQPGGGNFERPSFDRGQYGGNFHGDVGGFRQSAGGGHFGGGAHPGGGGMHFRRR